MSPPRKSRGRRRSIVASVLGLTLCAAAPAAAQIVNVQPLIMDPKREGLVVVGDSALDVRTGNTELLLVSGSLLARYRHGRQLVFALARREFGTEGGERFLSKEFEHLRYRLSLTERLDLESFVQHDRDEFRRLAWRVVGGLGPRVLVLSSEPADLALGVAYMQELEKLDRGPYPDSGEQELAHRLSSYVAFTLSVNDKVRFGQTAYAQPRLTQPSDVRVLSESELLLAINEVLSIKATLSIGYDSAPADGRRELDTVTKTGLQLRLK